MRRVSYNVCFSLSCLNSPGHRQFCPYHFVWYNWSRQNQDMSFPRLDKVFVFMPSRPIWDEFPLSKMIYLLNDLYSTCRAFLTISWRGGIHWTIHFRIWITKSKHRNGSHWTLNLAAAILLTISFLANGLICIIYIFEQPLYSVSLM